MRFVIVTGMSGAGKSTALKMLEDMGYFCVDNLPVPLLPKFAEMIAMPDSKLNQAAVGIDIRGGQAFRGLEGYLKELDESGIHYEILFLDAGNDVLLKRYKETRRQHPLGGAGHIDRGIAKEREEIAFLKIRATFILDTSKMLTRELRVELEKIFVKGKDFKNLYITVMSFGFKYGIPQDADLVFDVRFLPNPYYIEELRAKTGNEAEVTAPARCAMCAPAARAAPTRANCGTAKGGISRCGAPPPAAPECAPCLTLYHFIWGTA